MSTAKLLKHAPRTKPTVKYETITPSQAQQWLDKPAKNRTLSDRRVTLYAHAMQRGDWLLTSQGIAFDEFDTLIDGQHRLHAIVKAGVPIEMLVIRAASNRSQLVLDQGAKRTPHDQIGLREGWKVLPIHTAVAKSMLSSVGGYGQQERREIASDIQLLDRFYVKHHKAIEFAVENLWVKQKIDHRQLRGVCIAPVIAPVARAFYSVDHNLLLRFCDVLQTGISEGRDESPIVVLRNWLLAGRELKLSTRQTKDRYIIYKKTELGLSAFLTGRTIQNLNRMVLEKELFPIPGDTKAALTDPVKEK